MYAVYSDNSKAVIIAIFDSQPDLAEWPNQAGISASDAVYAAFYAAQPIGVQRGMITPTAIS